MAALPPARIMTGRGGGALLFVSPRSSRFDRQCHQHRPRRHRPGALASTTAARAPSRSTAAPIFQIEPDAIQRRCTALNDCVGDLSRTREIVDSDLERVAGDEIARHSPSVDVVELLFEPQSGAFVSCLPSDATVGELSLDAGQGVCILPLGVTGLFARDSTASVK